MDFLDETSVKELQNTLDNVKRNKPTQWFLAAIAYKYGVTQIELAEWQDIGRRTIYNWLKRFDIGESLEQIVTDHKRIGRKRKYTHTYIEQQEFEETVHEPPEEVGIELLKAMPESCRSR